MNIRTISFAIPHIIAIILSYPLALFLAIAKEALERAESKEAWLRRR